MMKSILCLLLVAVAATNAFTSPSAFRSIVTDANNRAAEAKKHAFFGSVDENMRLQLNEELKSNLGSGYVTPKPRKEGGLVELDCMINPDGTVQIHIKGIKGPGCTALADKLSHYLGGEVISRENTHEYYEQPLVEDNTVTLYAERGDEEANTWTDW
mmetsp:Transcript_50306/g.75162  ORF Transcript_50306/g.75162 Transcript_50306/m.75162 type:complete len:157 (-) Transcript_50306:166-636(-)